VVGILLPAQGPAGGPGGANPLTKANCGSLPDRKITYGKWARGSRPGPVMASGLVRGGMGQAALGVMVMGWPSSASICRMWFLIFLSLSVRAW